MICLIGIDGSGKTAHAFKIIVDLQKNGEKCKYVWFGSSYFFSYLCMAFGRLLGFTRLSRTSSLIIPEHEYYRNRPLALMWPWIQLVDLTILIPFRVYIPLWRGYRLVCDRFIPDILVEIMTDIRDKKLYDKLVGRLILKTVPRFAKTILLDVDESIASRRKLDIPSLKYLAYRRSNYISLSDLLGIPVIDARQSFMTVHGRIMKEVEERRGPN